MRALAEKVIRICRELALCSEEPGRTTRTFLSQPMRQVHGILGAWMREMGMQIRIDAAGNLRGVRATSAARVLIGSHLDTVPNAGAFDGILGVVLAIALAEAVPESPLEIVGYSEEEGVRFGFPFIGSRALVGSLDAVTLFRRDRDGISVAEAVRSFGLDPEEIPGAVISPSIAAFLEFHIEQGPVLDYSGLPLGIVDNIVGQSRLKLTFTGKANHAGTTPMALRRDALVAAAEWILEVERYACAGSELVATAGTLTILPNAGNVIPGEVQVSLDVRHASDTERLAAVHALVQQAADIALPRGIEFHYEMTLDQPAVALDPTLRARLEQAVQRAGYPARHINSGAGHDAMILAPHIPTAMLFLRSPGGLSHHPDEGVNVEDVQAALETGVQFLVHA